MSVPFILPAANEATAPPERRGRARDGVRLLVTDRAARTHRDAAFRDIASFVRRGDLLVANDSATIPAALVAHRGDGTPLALHLSTRIADDLWIVEPRNADHRRAEPREPVTAGERAALAEDGAVTFLAPVDASHPRLWYAGLKLPRPVDVFLARHGAPIRYRYVTDSFPLADYQTIFARVPGSAEMPSAGRPFTERVLDDIRDVGASVATITLHTGVSSPERHERPYREWYAVPAATAAAVNATHRRGGRVIAIGTTVVRALESAAASTAALIPGAAARGEAIAASGWTDLIVTLERGVAVVDGLLTGLHEPEASHLDLLRAFADEPLLERAYDRALANGYLWHEFGDVHLLL
ncbi:MAG: Queuosine biosynthesis protein [Candidatus Eremiobacteraeota bacterium]|nr:Queuosine biosynthesis protein [Candidatus Eremiobacteraeota bacterium]